MAKRHRKQAVCRKRAIHDVDTAKTWAIGISRALIIEKSYFFGRNKSVCQPAMTFSTTIAVLHPAKSTTKSFLRLSLTLSMTSGFLPRPRRRTEDRCRWTSNTDR